MNPIGLSTGCFYEHASPLSEEILLLSKNISSEALEICCVGGFTIDGHHLDDIKPSLLHGVNFISLHSPCGITSHNRYADDKETHEVLQRLQEVSERLPIKHVVFHTDTIKDWKIFRNYKINVALENLDNRKSFGLDVEQMKFAFDQIDCGFVLDLNHCYTLDTSMKLADELLNNFSDRLCEVHISGHKKYHDLLFETKQEAISKYIKQFDVPLIIESLCKNWQDAKNEFDYIESFT